MIRLRAIEGEGAVSRVAFAVPDAGGAIRRNRAKRRLRAAIAPLLLEWPRLDLVVSLPGRASEMPFTDLRAALSTAIGTAARRARP
jgi:ribonuclease P protein component